MGGVGEDARRSVLRLTEQGSRLHHELSGRTARMNQIFLAPVDPQEQAVFLELLQRVSATAEALRNPATRPPDRPVP